MEETTTKHFPNRKYARNEMEAEEGASHGLTKGQLQDVYDLQRQNLKAPSMSANVDGSYELNKHEKHLYHVKITIPNFDQSTGEDKSLTSISMFHPNMFAQCEASGVWDGRIVTILHDPSKVLHFDKDGKFAKRKEGHVRDMD